MKTLLLGTLTALLALTPKTERAQAQGLFTPTAEGCAAIIDPAINADCQEAYKLRQFFQGELEDIHTIYQLAELVQPATVWISPGYGETLTFEPPARVIVLQQFILADTGAGSHGFIFALPLVIMDLFKPAL